MSVFGIGVIDAVGQEGSLGTQGYAEYVSGNWLTLGNCLASKRRVGRFNKAGPINNLLEFEGMEGKWQYQIQ